MFSQKEKPLANDADVFVNKVFSVLKSNDSLAFKALFVKSTHMKVENEIAEMLENRMIFNNFYELKSHLVEEFKTDLKPGNIKMQVNKLKDKKTKQKLYVYAIQASINNLQNVKKILDFNCVFENKNFVLLNAIAYNELVELTE